MTYIKTYGSESRGQEEAGLCILYSIYQLTKLQLNNDSRPQSPRVYALIEALCLNHVIAIV